MFEYYSPLRPLGAWIQNDVKGAIQKEFPSRMKALEFVKDFMKKHR